MSPFSEIKPVYTTRLNSFSGVKLRSPPVFARPFELWRESKQPGASGLQQPTPSFTSSPRSPVWTGGERSSDLISIDQSDEALPDEELSGGVSWGGVGWGGHLWISGLCQHTEHLPQH